MSGEEYDKYKKIVDNLDGYDICDKFNLSTYELKDKKKLLEIVLIHYFKNQDEIERLNNIIDTFIEEIEVELSIDEKDALLEHNTYIAITDTLEKVLKRIKELKEGK